MPSLNLPAGGKLTYGESGEGPTLVLVHGSPGDGRSWGRVLRHLGGFRVLTPDLPGYGGSDPVAPEALGRTRRMATSLATLLAVQKAPVLLAGHSFGGNVALHAALQVSQQVSGLLLLEPVFFRALALAGDTAAYDAAHAIFGDYVERVLRGETTATTIMVDYWFGTGAFDKLPRPVADFLRAATPRNALDVRSCFAEDLSAAALRSFDRPAIVASGDDTSTVAPGIARALAGLLPRARLRTMPGTNHGMLDSRPDSVAALLRELAAG